MGAFHGCLFAISYMARCRNLLHLFFPHSCLLCLRGGYLFALSESKMELSVKAIVRKAFDLFIPAAILGIVLLPIYYTVNGIHDVNILVLRTLSSDWFLILYCVVTVLINLIRLMHISVKKIIFPMCLLMVAVT